MSYECECAKVWNGYKWEVVHLSNSPTPEQALIRKLTVVLLNLREAIMEADPEVLTDTLWMPEYIFKGGTVVDYIDHAIEITRAK